ncbi:unnamed protein product [Allacma fusca]|uniref:Uncharacterized protein n=1 Tax=Allacma fusca TaxID=39272 RepID=A0A8J2NQ68_9HEXA|nr:unnamed protein product [Allacma fusca]
MPTEDSNMSSPLPPPPINNAPIGPGNHARAWNDPPMFSTEVNVSARPPPNKLNKRVAYPISSQNVNSQTRKVPFIVLCNKEEDLQG